MQLREQYLAALRREKQDNPKPNPDRKKFRKLRGIQTAHHSFRFPLPLIARLKAEAAAKRITLTEHVMEKLSRKDPE